MSDPEFILPLAVGAGSFVILAVCLAVLHRMWELHHGYYGIVMLNVVAILHPHGPWWLAFAWVGTVFIIDDTIQHAAQALGMVPAMHDFTPLHNLGARVMGLDWKRMGWAAPIGIIIILAGLAIFFATRAMP